MVTNELINLLRKVVAPILKKPLFFSYYFILISFLFFFIRSCHTVLYLLLFLPLTIHKTRYKFPPFFNRFVLIKIPLSLFLFSQFRASCSRKPALILSSNAIVVRFLDILFCFWSFLPDFCLFEFSPFFLCILLVIIYSEVCVKREYDQEKETLPLLLCTFLNLRKVYLLQLSLSLSLSVEVSIQTREAAVVSLKL